NVICERYCWILDDADVVAVPLEDFVNVSPTRAIHEATVDENDCLYSRIRFSSHNVFLSCVFVGYSGEKLNCVRGARQQSGFPEAFYATANGSRTAFAALRMPRFRDRRRCSVSF